MSVLVVGGAGVLGRSVLRSFTPSIPKVASTISVDLDYCDESNQSIIIDQQDTNTNTILNTASKVADVLKTGGIESVDTIICTAGSWAGGNVDTVEGLDAIESMWQANVQSAVLTAHLATKFLNPNGGLLVFTGADGALMKPTPFMMGYGLAKTATHHLALSLASKNGDSGLSFNTSVITLLPKVIDTPNNRKYMSEFEPFDEWAKPNDIAKQIKYWNDNKNNDRPESGSFISLNTIKGKTTFDIFGHPLK
mmetsp:Transcript_32764/g.42090  ORF Transcript_32764/g.42090 Transcript_32764/m.42090 type:complete len:251 (+) Transcript_32764:14-766(+)